MRRAMPEILASQRQTLIRRGEDPDRVSDEEMARLYQKHLDLIERWIATQPNIQRIDVNYNELLQNPIPYIAQVKRFLGYRLDIEKMAQVVDPSLYRQRKQ